MALLQRPGTLPKLLRLAAAEPDGEEPGAALGGSRAGPGLRQLLGDLAHRGELPGKMALEDVQSVLNVVGWGRICVE